MDDWIVKGENSGNLLQEIWKNMTSILKDEFNKTAESLFQKDFTLF